MEKGNNISKFLYDDRGGERKERLAKANDPNRGQVLPLYKNKDETVDLAWPQWMLDAYNAYSLPGDAVKGYQPTGEDITNFGLSVAGGGMGSSLATKTPTENTLGMFLGRKAKGADTKALAQAMSMADRGIDRDTIIEETGWFLDKDGKWKFEIPDNNLKLNMSDDEFAGVQKGVVESGVSERVLPAEPTFRAVKHDELFGNYPSPEAGKAVPSHGIVPIHEPSFKKEGVWGTPSYREVSAFPTTQIGVINPDEKLTSYNYSGSYIPDMFGDKIITKGTTKDKVRWVLAHELQHAVQQREGFQSGGNQTNMADWQKEIASVVPDEGWDYFDVLDKVKSIEDSIKDTQFQIKDIESNSSGWTFIDKGIEGDIDSWIDYSDLKDTLRFLQEDLELAKATVGQIEKDLGPIVPELKELKKLTNLSSFEAYQRLSGEVEARLVQKRMDYTPEQRKNIKPWEDLDIPEDQIIVVDKVSKVVEKLSEKVKDLKEKEAQKGYEQGLNELLNPEDRRGYAKGGMVIDPVSGNEVPPGAKPEEVRDDIPIKASEGEYIIPANVVRYIGVDKLEKMVMKAKEALGEMEDKGRIGGAPEDELPFDPSELIGHPMEEEVQSFAEGGVVEQTGGGSALPQEQGFTGTKKFKKGDQVIFIPFQNGVPFLPIPAGYEEMVEGSPTLDNDPNKATAPLRQPSMPRPSVGNGPSPNEGIAPSPLAGSPTQWSADNFISYGKQKGSLDSKLIKGIISVLPGGAMALKAREKYLDSTVTQLFDTMMESGVDPRGVPITPEQRTMLSETREKLKSQMSQSSGLNLNPIERLTDAFSQFQNFLGGKPLQKPQTFQPSGQAQGKPLSSVSPQATQMLNPQTNKSDNQYSGGSVKVGSDLGKKNNGPTAGSMRSGGLYSKGGLVARRNKNMATDDC